MWPTVRFLNFIFLSKAEVFSLTIKALLISAIPFLAFADEWTELDGKEPNATKERVCRKLVTRHGYRSQQMNKDYYGKGVREPKARDWYLIRIKKPGWFGGDLFYVFQNKTSDGFIHEASCRFNDFDDYEFAIHHFDLGFLVLCTRFGDPTIQTEC